MSETGRFIKDPQSNLDYQIDWTAWLAGDTISASSWSAGAGITVGANTHTDAVATVWLSGGSAGSSYVVTNQITTTSGRIDERAITILVRDR